MQPSERTEDEEQRVDSEPTGRFRTNGSNPELGLTAAVSTRSASMRFFSHYKSAFWWPQVSKLQFQTLWTLKF